MSEGERERKRKREKQEEREKKHEKEQERERMWRDEERGKAGERATRKVGEKADRE